VSAQVLPPQLQPRILFLDNRTAADSLPAPGARGWTKILADYREPSHALRIFELAITFVPLAALWALAWTTSYLGLWSLSLLFAIPAAGVLVRLFMIQLDCGHGPFFRQRLVNDRVGRAIRVPT
jgi:acyl-lipid omega-6 desaturase (Delta-12 desaturase)